MWNSAFRIRRAGAKIKWWPRSCPDDATLIMEVLFDMLEEENGKEEAEDS
jgi:hypothetical protein